MKLFLLAVAVAAVSAQVLDYSAPVNNLERINYINSLNTSWKAAAHEMWEGKTLGDVKAMLGVLPSEGPSDLPIVTYPNYKASDEFNGYDVWGKCAHAIRNQGHCGSCWAFGASEALSDRFCIEEGVDVVLSAQQLVSCDHHNYGCQGGYLDKAWNFMASNGLVPDDCYPYTSGTSQQTGTCHSSCTGNGDWKLHHATGVHQNSRAEAAIRAEVEKFGPAEVAFTVYEDFMNYSSGVYKHTSGRQLGGHAVKLMGWGNEGGLDYWLIANSWGTGWGDGGKFKIVRGQNECGIESDVVSGMAGKHD